MSINSDKFLTEKNFLSLPMAFVKTRRNSTSFGTNKNSIRSLLWRLWLFKYMEKRNKNDNKISYVQYIGHPLLVKGIYSMLVDVGPLAEGRRLL